MYRKCSSTAAYIHVRCAATDETCVPQYKYIKTHAAVLFREAQVDFAISTFAKQLTPLPVDTHQPAFFKRRGR
jgi:hypothetical protein